MKKYLYGSVILFLGIVLSTIASLNIIFVVEGTMGYFSVMLGIGVIIYGTIDILAQKFNWFFRL